MEREMANIGKSVIIKGELSGSEDLTIEGQVEGRIELREHLITVGPQGKVKAEIFAKVVVVSGSVVGNVTASEKVDIREGGAVDGDLTSPRVAIADGAHFRGSVDMQRAPQTAAKPETRTETKPVAASAPVTAPAAAAAGQLAGQRPKVEV